MKLISSVAYLCLINFALATYNDGHDSHYHHKYKYELKDTSTAPSDSGSTTVSSESIPSPETSTLQTTETIFTTETILTTETLLVTPTPSTEPEDSAKASCQKTSLPVVTGEPISIVDPMTDGEDNAPIDQDQENIINQDLENGAPAQNELAMEDLYPHSEIIGDELAQPTQTLDADYSYGTDFDPNLLSGDVRNMAYGTLILLAMVLI